MPAASRLGRPSAPLPLEPLVGSMWVPVWAVRPGSYDAVREFAGEMSLWLLIFSRNLDYWRPCYASRDQLGATIGAGTTTVSKRLDRLKRGGLLFEVARGQDQKSRIHRPPARWALDPFTVDRWRPELEKVLAAIAEEDGQSRMWLNFAVRRLDQFERHSRALRNRIAETMPTRPRPARRSKGPRPRAGRR